MAAVLLLAGLSACSNAPPPPTVVALTLTTTADANGGASGPGAPVEVRVYQLASTNAFDGASFFQLYNSANTTLGSDLVHVDKYLMAPGKTKVVTLTPSTQVKALGIFVAYGAYQSATWRASVAVPPHKTTPVVVTIGRAAVSAKAAGL